MIEPYLRIPILWLNRIYVFQYCDWTVFAYFLIVIEPYFKIASEDNQVTSKHASLATPCTAEPCPVPFDYFIIVMNHHQIYTSSLLPSPTPWWWWWPGQSHHCNVSSLSYRDKFDNILVFMFCLHTPFAHFIFEFCHYAHIWRWKLVGSGVLGATKSMHWRSIK